MKTLMKLAVLPVLLGVVSGELGADTSCRVSNREITLSTGNRIYTLGDDGRIQPLGIYVNIAGTDRAAKGVWLVPTRLREAKVLTDADTAKVVRGTWDLSDGAPRYELELELEVRDALPALFVKSHVRRLTEGSGESYS